jgi:hypothetical protein
VYASWISQFEIYYSIVQRKVLEPNDSDNLAGLARTLLHALEHHWNGIANPSTGTSPATTSPRLSTDSQRARTSAPARR